jgi:hypothetical protein
MEKQPRELTILAAQVDWYTLTSFEPTGWQFWTSIFDKLTAVEFDGNTGRLMYTGKLWTMANGTAYLGSGYQEGKEHLILQVSGALAEQTFSQSAKKPIAEAWAKCTRLDLQITVPEPDNWSQWGLFNRLKKLGRNVNYISSKTGPNRTELATIYIGSRWSTRMIRIYEKAADNTVYLRCEAELKRQIAHKTAKQVLIDPDKIDEYLLGEIQAMLEPKSEREFSQYLSGLPSRENGKIVKLPDRTEKWLMKQVLPAFTKYVNQHDSNLQVIIAFSDVIANIFDNYRPSMEDNE